MKSPQKHTEPPGWSGDVTQQLHVPPELLQSMAMLHGLLVSQPHSPGHWQEAEVIVPVHLHASPLLQVASGTCLHFSLDSGLRNANPQSPDWHESSFLQNFLARRSPSFSNLRMAAAWLQA
jgi:hypothetical protein